MGNKLFIETAAKPLIRADYDGAQAAFFRLRLFAGFFETFPENDG